jgi:hypothetical protein
MTDKILNQAAERKFISQRDYNSLSREYKKRADLAISIGLYKIANSAAPTNNSVVSNDDDDEIQGMMDMSLPRGFR